MIGTWLRGIHDTIAIQLIAADAEGVDLDDLAALRKWAYRNDQLKLAGWLSANSRKRQQSLINIMRLTLKPQWEDETDGGVRGTIKDQIKPFVHN